MRVGEGSGSPAAGMRLWLMAVMAVMALAGCAAGATTRPPPQPAPDAEQILRMPVVTSQPLTLDPALIADPGSAMVASLMYPSLLALDSQMATHPWAAQSVDVSADGLTLTFHLRGGMRFSNGEPLTAQTFAYSLNRALNPCAGAPNARLLFPIASAVVFHQEICADAVTGVVAGPIMTLVGAGEPIDAPDPLTLIVRLDKPGMGLLAALTAPVAFAVPAGLVERDGSQWVARLAEGDGVGGGLFRLAQAPRAGVSGQEAEARLTRNPQFWGAAARLREIDVLLYPSTEREWADYQAGKLDIGLAPPAIAASGAAGTTLRSTPLLRLVYVGLNWGVDSLRSEGLRQALALAIDKRRLALGVLGEVVVATNHLMPAGEPGYNPALVGPDLTRNLTGNTAQAVKLARAFASSRCMGQFSLCPALTLEVATADSSALAAAATIVRMWQAVAPGYPLRVRPEPLAALESRVASGAAQLYLDEWTAAYPDPSAWLDAPFGPGATGVGSGVVTPDVTTLLTQGEAEQDPTQRARDYQAAEQLLVSAVAWIPLYQEQEYWQARPALAGATLDSQGALAVYDTAPSLVVMRLAAGR